jgi:hypothetical protein
MKSAGCGYANLSKPGLPGNVIETHEHAGDFKE